MKFRNWTVYTGTFSKESHLGTSVTMSSLVHRLATLVMFIMCIRVYVLLLMDCHLF